MHTNVRNKAILRNQAHNTPGLIIFHNLHSSIHSYTVILLINILEI